MREWEVCVGGWCVCARACAGHSLPLNIAVPAFTLPPPRQLLSLGCCIQLPPQPQAPQIRAQSHLSRSINHDTVSLSNFFFFYISSSRQYAQRCLTTIFLFLFPFFQGPSSFLLLVTIWNFCFLLLLLLCLTVKLSSRAAALCDILPERFFFSPPPLLHVQTAVQVNKDAHFIRLPSMDLFLF